MLTLPCCAMAASIFSHQVKFKIYKRTALRKVGSYSCIVLDYLELFKSSMVLALAYLNFGFSD